jgi:hypothetical protein
MIKPPSRRLRMPNHWRPIEPDNPNPKQREQEVRKAANDHGGKVCFVGCKQGARDEWWVMVDVTDVPKHDLPKMAEHMRVKEGVDPEIWLNASEL